MRSVYIHLAFLKKLRKKHFNARNINKQFPEKEAAIIYEIYETKFNFAHNKRNTNLNYIAYQTGKNLKN